MSKIFIEVGNPNSFDVRLEYVKEHRCNLAFKTFVDPHILDTNWQEILKNYQQKLHEFKGAISVHGAFNDLVISSIDKKIQEVTRQRIFQSLEIARELKAKHIVFHSKFDWLSRIEGYKLNWIEKNAIFWSEVLEKYPSTVVLENTNDQTPEMLRALVDEVNSSRLKVCLDVGHMNVFSKVPLKEWIAVLGQDIRLIHVHDNKGDFDSHLAPGKGAINWQEFSDLIAKYHIDPDMEFEMGLEQTIQTLKYFREENIYPCNTFASNSKEGC